MQRVEVVAVEAPRLGTAAAVIRSAWSGKAGNLLRTSA